MYHQLLRARETVRAPRLTADAMVDHEQAIRIVTAFDIRETPVIRTPERPLPVRLEIVMAVNAELVTAPRPVGSGDYALELGSVTVPLSRRFPAALAKLRGG